LPAHAASISINNGGFEAGLAGWTTADLLEENGGSFFSQTGTASPVLAFPVPAPPGGSRAAMSDSGGPGAHVLYQDFVVPVGLGTTFLNFDVFIGNRADRFVTPNTFDWFTPALNQQARVDLLHGGTDPFSLSSSDVVSNAFHTSVGDPLVSGYTHFSVDITSALATNAGTTLRLRFAEVDNIQPFQFGVDNVSIAAAPAASVPEPSVPLLVIAGLVMWAAHGTFRARRAGARRKTLSM
jgi:hypothetical protein